MSLRFRMTFLAREEESYVPFYIVVWSSQASGGEAPEAEGSSFSLWGFCVLSSFRRKQNECFKISQILPNTKWKQKLKLGVPVHVCMYAVWAHVLEFLFPSHCCHTADVWFWLNINFFNVNIFYESINRGPSSCWMLWPLETLWGSCNLLSVSYFVPDVDNFHKFLDSSVLWRHKMSKCELQSIFSSGENGVALTSSLLCWSTCKAIHNANAKYLHLTHHSAWLQILWTILCMWKTGGISIWHEAATWKPHFHFPVRKNLLVNVLGELQTLGIW